MLYKTKQFDIKSVSDTGELTGYFSTYQPVADSYGDCVAPGCFTETIKAWAEKGKFILSRALGLRHKTNRNKNKQKNEIRRINFGG